MKTLFDMIERLTKAGFPESTAKKIVSGELPMDEASRMARAREQGFDVDTPLYRGSTVPERKLTTSTGHEHYIEGISTSPDPEYAAMHGSNVMSLLGPKGGQEDFFQLIQRIDKDDSLTDSEIAKIARSEGVKASVLYDPLAGGSGVDIRILDPKNLRSTEAAFDPENIGKPSIMGGAASVGVGGLLGALGLPQDATAADIAFAERPELSEQGQQDAQQMVLDILMNYFAPTRLAGREAQMMPMSQQMRGR